jgi:hypothetical protein
MSIFQTAGKAILGAIISAFMREAAKDYIKSWFSWVPAAIIAAPEVVFLFQQSMPWRERVFLSMAVLGGIGFLVVGVRMIFVDRVATWMLLRSLPLKMLNNIEAAEKEFTDADSLFKRQATSHVWNWEPSRFAMKEVYWRAVRAGNVLSNYGSPEEAQHFMKKWFDDLLEYWHTIDEIEYVTIHGHEDIRKQDFKRLLKRHKIPWPLTWR